MSKKTMIGWCIALGLLDGLYCILCTFLPHVCNFMWIGFISLPIFFAGGADIKQAPRYAVCSICGVGWGALTEIILGVTGLNWALNYVVVLTIVVGICCYVHMFLLTEDKLGGLFASCPAAFGGFAAIFSQGVGETIPVCCTLVLGVVLGVIMAWIVGPIGKIFDK